MEFWDKFKDNFSKTLSDVEKRTKDIRETVNSELQIRSLKSKLEELHAEQSGIYREMGEQLYSMIDSKKDFQEEQYLGKVDYIRCLRKKMEDLELQMNEIYKTENEHRAKQDEIVVEPDQDGDESKGD